MTINWSELHLSIDTLNIYCSPYHIMHIIPMEILKTINKIHISQRLTHAFGWLCWNHCIANDFHITIVSRRSFAPIKVLFLSIILCERILCGTRAYIRFFLWCCILCKQENSLCSSDAICISSYCFCILSLTQCCVSMCIYICMYKICICVSVIQWIWSACALNFSSPHFLMAIVWSVIYRNKTISIFWGDGYSLLCRLIIRTFSRAG